MPRSERRVHYGVLIIIYCTIFMSSSFISGCIIRCVMGKRKKRDFARNERIILKTNAVLRGPRDSSKVVFARATQTLIITA